MGYYSDDEHDALATPADAIREWVWNVGADCPEREWLCSDYDSWVKNPHYKGEPGPHPEQDPEEENYSKEGEVDFDGVDEVAESEAYAWNDAQEDFPF